MVYAVNIVKSRPKKRPSMSSTRRALFRVHNGICAYCRCKTEMPSLLGPPHQRTATIDHIVPLSRGGAMRGDNITLACSLCNGLKGNMTPQEWTEFMIANPQWWLKKSPKYLAIAETKRILQDGKKAWKVWRAQEQQLGP